MSIAVVAVAAFAMAMIARADAPAHVVIAEVQVAGASTIDEFIELYNPTVAAIALEGWRLSKRTGTGAREENLVTAFPALTIASHASVLVAHPQSVFAAGADVRYTTQSALANDNAVILYGAPDAEGKRTIVDLVGFGAATLREGTAIANPPAGQSVERKPGGDQGNGQDTDDNATDLAPLVTPTPQGTSAAARPPLTSPAHSPPAPPPTNDAPAPPPENPPPAPPLDLPPTNDAPPAPPPPPAAPSPSPADPPPAPSPPPGATQAAPVSSGGAPLVAVIPPVKINEFVADPADGDEWIELVHMGSVPVNLADWVIEDGAETRTVLSGAIGVGDQRFAVVRKPKGQLNNSGDRIVLLAPGGRTADAVSYGTWDDGKVSDNAPAASDPASVARIVDGQDTDSDRLDFVRTETPTPGSANAVSAMPTGPGDGTPPRAGIRNRAIVVLNELFPNPPGDDRQDEYIELANIGDAAADVSGWRVRDELRQEYVIVAADGPTAIPAGAKLVLGRPRTGIALNNTGGETVRLFTPESERATSIASYIGTAAEHVSWARASDGRWSWTTERTPGTANVIRSPNRAPDAVIEAPEDAAPGAIVAFDASDSVDLDRDALAYAWDFGDARTEADHATGALGRYVYAEPGTYVVRLTVTDARGAVMTTAHRVVVRAPVADTATVPMVPTTSAALRVSEILPNPSGADDGEWVEIVNDGAIPAALDGWALVVSGGTSASRRIELHDLLAPANGYALVQRPLLRGNLRNDGGTIALVDPFGAQVDATTYAAAREGSAWARGRDGQWVWATPTPGSANAPGVAVQPRVAGWTSGTIAKLTDLDSVDLGARVTVRGAVSAPLGAVGAQVFYLADATGGVQVYVGKREIPALAVGDRVVVSGELRNVSGERRVGIVAASDMRVIGHDGTVADAVPLRAQDAREELIGSLIAVEGEVVEVRGRTFTMDDGSEEIRAVLPGAEVVDPIAEGDVVRIAGILTRTRAGYRVLARTAADIDAIAKAAPPAVARATAPRLPPRTMELVALAALALGAGAFAVWRRFSARGLA